MIPRPNGLTLFILTNSLLSLQKERTSGSLASLYIRPPATARRRSGHRRWWPENLTYPQNAPLNTILKPKTPKTLPIGVDLNRKSQPLHLPARPFTSPAFLLLALLGSLLFFVFLKWFLVSLFLRLWFSLVFDVLAFIGRFSVSKYGAGGRCGLTGKNGIDQSRFSRGWLLRDRILAGFLAWLCVTCSSLVRRNAWPSYLKTLSGPVSDPSKLPKWNYDGSSTGQAPGEDSEVILYPQAIFRDPFRRGKNILVMCDAYTPAGEPIPTNKRCNAAKIFSNPDVAKDVKWPLGWPLGGYPGPQGPYYCGVGADKAYGRDIVDSHYKSCLFAGINISGINGEVMPGQWEFQVGPAVGISAGDELWVARYILERITEIAGVVLSFDPKPIQGDWNGAGAHTNYSTKSMRSDGGYEVIKTAIEKLGLRHKEHISAYGEGNERRLTGRHETADINTFLWGVANRGASIRVGRDTEKSGKGYFEDRRPASNMDPYGPYYCGVGADKAYGRDIVDSHYKACLFAGINISGINGEVMPGQRITEIVRVVLSFDPKPIQGDWNGADAHTNYSTKSMRSDGGYEDSKKAIEKLGLRHREHIAAYGEGNERRLTRPPASRLSYCLCGLLSPQNVHTMFFYVPTLGQDVANRGASIRVGRDTEKARKGYFEDRRPASNMDPYVATSMIAETTILWKP
ncbi:Glutamine synthetase cytosolic isozyme 2 [Hibiscus syriacus]|uniref:Glutamine synthetase n=2 Tax=Magnoliopsida TaxID=3398 RepID=A0A6A2Z115_HIBSY|nr:Glutamine synthetase cytosolic isozyme 2 [Hibiscus syriacus]